MKITLSVNEHISRMKRQLFAEYFFMFQLSDHTFDRANKQIELFLK